jgi:CelD/BcsL family acetyltransferase involved in cellulose biosynthesis
VEHEREGGPSSAPPAAVHSSVTTLAEFERLAPEWDALVLATSRPSPFLLHGWLSAWIRGFLQDGQLHVETLRHDGRLVAALPLCVRRRGGLRRMEFLGGGESALGDLLVSAERGAVSLSDLVGRIGDIDHDFADLFGLPGGSRLEQALGPEQLRLIERVEAPVLDLPDGWEAAYRQKVSAKHRYAQRRKLRLLSEIGNVEFRLSRRPDELGPALEAAFVLHRLRWQGRPDGSEFGSARGMAFHREALEAIAPLGVPRIVSLLLDGRPIAFSYYLLLGGRMYSHRLAFDPEFARYSVGRAAAIESIAAASREGAERVEFLGGAESYKMELADRLEPLYEGIGSARTLRGHLAVSARFATIAARRRLKRSRRIHRLYLDGFGRVRRGSERLQARRERA